MPRAGLSTARVVEAAADLADRGGLGALSLAGLAEGLGVRVPSLYKHVDGLPALRRGVALLGAAGLRDALGAALDEARRRRDPLLPAAARAYRDYAKACPGRYEAALRAPDPGDADLAHVAAEVAALVTEVLRDDEHARPGAAGVHQVRALRAALHGFVALEAAGGFGLPVDVDASFDHLVGVLGRGLHVPPPAPATAMPPPRPGARGGS